MRLWAVPVALMAVLPSAAPAWAARGSVPVRVQVTVPESCSVAAPRKLARDPSGKPVLRADTLIGGCTVRSVPPLLSVREDALENGVYIATLDF